MDQQIRGISWGTYPEIGTDKVIYITPPEYLSSRTNHLVTLGRSTLPNVFVMSFWQWEQDRRYKTEKRGTWSKHEVVLTNRHLKALKKIEVGDLQ
jgi:hypothetical protein